MKKVLSANVLKIIACLSMLIDHIGKIAYLFFPSDTMYWVNYSFSIIGRLAFPIFVFLLIEGFYHTSNIKKYFIRLGIMAIIIGLSEIILGLIPSLNMASTMFQSGNIFIDLILILAALYLFNHKDPRVKFLTLAPILYFVVSLLFQNETFYVHSDVTKAIMSGFLTQYSFVSPCLIVLFLIINYIYNYIIHRKFNQEVLDSIDLATLFKDIRINSYIFAVSILALLMYAFTYLITDTSILNTSYVINTYFILSIVPIFFYSGKLGKSNIYIKSAYYLFYPLHLGIIFLVTYLISLI